MNVKAEEAGGQLYLYTTSGDINLNPGAGKDVVIGGPSQVNSGVLKFVGNTTGLARLGVAGNAGTPNRINLPTTTGSNTNCLKTDGGNPQQTSWATCTVPAGSNTQVQFNDNGAIAGDTGITYDKTTGKLSSYNVNGIKFIDGVKYSTSDIGAGVNAAIADFGTAPLCGIIYLPLGAFNASTSLTLSGRYGCRLIGQGDGQSSSGTYITWTGAANGTMLSAAGCYSCEVTGFTLNGASSAGIGISYTTGGGLTSQQSSFHDLTILNLTGTPGQGIYVGSASNAQVSESRFDTIFEIGFVTGVRQEGINTLNITYKDMSFTATAPSLFCFDIAAGNFRGLHNTCEGLPLTATAAYNIASTVSTVDIINSYTEGSGAPVLNAVGASSSAAITLIGNNFGTAAANANFFNVTTNGSLILMGNGFHGTASTATYAPVGTTGAGFIGMLLSKGNQWSGVTLASSGSAYTAEVNDGAFTTSNYNNALSPVGSTHANVIDSTNLQLYKSPLTFYDGTTRYNVNVASTGFQILNASNSLIGGWNVGNPATAANFETNTINAASFKLRNGGTLRLMESSTAPTIAGAGCGGSAATIASNNGTAAFTINVGTAPTSACTITMPATTTGWVCSATDQTTPGTNDVKQTAGGSSTTSVTLTNFNSTLGTVASFTASDVLVVGCHGL